MSIESKAETAKQVAKQAVDDAADQGEKLIETSRAKAEAAHDQADAKLRSLRDDLKPAIDALTERLERLSDRGRQIYGDKADQTRAAVQGAADKTCAYVTDKPLQSVAMAAAAGAVLGLLLGRRR